ncbi:MAG: hypothetical protein JSV19_06015 [Phycisphaerales bacterium]|nr:MAG: hypothetical protein JSV19_06015 [Phycisphaerales bacterium]
MNTNINRYLVATVLIVLWGSVAAGVDPVLFSTGQPQAVDIGQGPHYYAVQSVLSTNWYPFEAGDTTAVGDWFTVEHAAQMTGVTFWGFFKNYGGGPGELHIYVYLHDTTTNGLIERLHAWDENTCDWDALHVADEDPSALGTENIRRWHVDLADVPNGGDSLNISPCEEYVLVVSGDDWADEFQWAAVTTNGLMGGQFDELYWSDTTDVTSSGLNWSRFGLGYGPVVNNMAFEITGTTRSAGDSDADGDVDLDDYVTFENCLSTSGPANRPPAQDCATTFDADCDRDVDLHDFAAFQQAFTG